MRVRLDHRRGSVCPRTTLDPIRASRVGLGGHCGDVDIGLGSQGIPYGGSYSTLEQLLVIASLHTVIPPGVILSFRLLCLTVTHVVRLSLI